MLLLLLHEVFVFGGKKGTNEEQIRDRGGKRK